MTDPRTRLARHIRPFTPSREDAASLAGRTVGFKRLRRRLHERFQLAAGSASRPHTLVVGPRGAGKSHLVRVVLHDLEMSDIASAFRSVVVPEDVVGLTRLDDLLDIVLDQLSVGRLGVSAHNAERERLISQALAGRVLVLTVENLNRFLEVIGIGGQRDLRAWVETSGEVLLLCTSPLLGPSVTKRERPWFGGFATCVLEGLKADEGRQLLAELARRDGNAELGEYLDSEPGRARVAAVAQLTGGSPRVWMILADCISAESLDALVPAVQDLLEGLVPYYQQLLWELAPNEQRVVRALAEGRDGALTVAEIAASAGMDQRTTATTLGRLASSQWVKAEKPSSGDRRRSLYRLREPMLRHHFQYRSGNPEPLILIVELLRAWFERTERQHELIRSARGSESMHYLAATFKGEASSLISSGESWDIDGLQAQARRWLEGEQSSTWGPDVALYLDRCLAVVRAFLGAAELEPLDGLADAEGSDFAHHVWAALAVIPRATPRHVIASVALRAASRSTTGRLSVALAVICCVWDSVVDPFQVREKIRSLIERMEIRDDLLWEARLMEARLTIWCGEHDEAIRLSNQLIIQASAALGNNHQVLLWARSTLASAYYAAGDFSRAIEIHRATLSDRIATLGAAHPDTLWSQSTLANTLEADGQIVEAIGLHEDTFRVRKQVLGSSHSLTLWSRDNLASALDSLGRHGQASIIHAEVLDDYNRTVGTDHPDAMACRRNLAVAYERGGRLDEALAEYERTLQDRERVLGADHPATLWSSYDRAHCLARMGNLVAALDVSVELLADLPGRSWSRALTAVTEELCRWCAGALVRGQGAESGTGVAAHLISALRGSGEALHRLPSELAELIHDG